MSSARLPTDYNRAIRHTRLGGGGHRLETQTWFPLPVADEQLRGPYHTWFHEHVFEAAQGGTRMTDRVTYRLPGHPLAGLLLPLVRRQLERIFRFRAETIARLVVPSPGDRREL